jgi:hypothetical protein
VKYQLPVSSNLRREGQSSAGMLSCKIEPAGKIRVFAMVDVVTQNVLRPLHNVLSKILKSLPNDGTFDQESMVDRAYNKAQIYGSAYCYDLSAATDRLPIIIQRSIIASLFGRKIASLWQAILVHRPYTLPDNKLNRYIFSGKDSKAFLGQDFYYSTGQPMGALSSFNMLGITHHLIVQYCAYQLYQKDNQKFMNIYNEKGWCISYEILGDDIAIFQEDLAKEYLRVMELIGVPINVKKSVISVSGKTVELAKRTIHNGKDVSAISFKDILSSTPFAQRVSIVDRVTRRNVMSLSRAIHITTNFYGEDPVIRRSYILISMFLRAYQQKQVSFLDVLFLLFLIKKYRKGGVSSEYSYHDRLTVIVENVVAAINNGRTSYSSSHTVFPIKLFSEHSVEFLSIFCILYSDLYYKVQENRFELADKVHSRNKSTLVLDKGIPTRIEALTHDFFTALLYPDVKAERPAGLETFIAAAYQDLNILFPEDKFFEDASGSKNIRTLLSSFQAFETRLRNSIGGAETINPVKYLDLSEPREPVKSNLSNFDGSSIDDLISVNEMMINYKRRSDLYNGIDVKKDILKYSPISDFTEIFDSMKTIDIDDNKVVPFIHVTVGTLKELNSFIPFVYELCHITKDIQVYTPNFILVDYNPVLETSKEG